MLHLLFPYPVLWLSTNASRIHINHSTTPTRRKRPQELVEQPKLQMLSPPPPPGYLSLQGTASHHSQAQLYHQIHDSHFYRYGAISDKHNKFSEDSCTTTSSTYYASSYPNPHTPISIRDNTRQRTYRHLGNSPSLHCDQWQQTDRKRLPDELEASVRTTHNLTLQLMPLDAQTETGELTSGLAENVAVDLPKTPTKPLKKVRRGRAKKRDSQTRGTEGGH